MVKKIFMASCKQAAQTSLDIFLVSVGTLTYCCEVSLMSGSR